MKGLTLSVAAAVVFSIGVGGFVFSSRFARLTFEGYDQEHDGKARVAQLRFHNDSDHDLRLALFFSLGGVTSWGHVYRSESPENGEWGDVLAGGEPKARGTYHVSYYSVQPGESHLIRVPIPKDASPTRLGVPCWSRGRPSARLRFYNLRYRLARSGFGTTPLFQTGMDVVWCDTVLSGARER